MGTVIRSSISSSNPYHISKHRFLELKHFCLQYPEWKLKAYSQIRTPGVPYNAAKRSGVSDPVAEAAARRETYLKRMQLVEQAAVGTDPDIYEYLIKSVTLGYSYTYLKTYLDLPCGRDYFYERYRKFYYLLDKARE